MGEYPTIASNMFYLDPHSGEIVGEKYWGRCCFEPENLLNYLYEMHHSLTDGTWGGYLMGGVAWRAAHQLPAGAVRRNRRFTNGRLPCS